MDNSVKLSEVVELAKTTGHLGWLKINDASKVIANAICNVVSQMINIKKLELQLKKR